MQIVIELEKPVYNDIIKGMRDVGDAEVYFAIINGIPLPEGHGNLKDIDSIFNEGFPKADINAEYEENIKEYPYWRTDITGFQSILKNAPTIIEADKEV